MNVYFFIAQLILGYANQTLSLKPEHKYVPWMTLNGEPLYEVYITVFIY